MRCENVETTSGLLSSGSHARSPAEGACMLCSFDLFTEQLRSEKKGEHGSQCKTAVPPSSRFAPACEFGGKDPLLFSAKSLHGRAVVWVRSSCEVEQTGHREVETGKEHSGRTTMVSCGPVPAKLLSACVSAVK